ncbi:MAG: hypothetical protein VXX86_07960 [Planctomycetota bacterium]|nr:hypothetical protein [Planctomycetota bacterium]
MPRPDHPNFRTPRRILLALIMLLHGGLVAGSSVAQETTTPPVAAPGARCLFAGHSFFCPVAIQFDHLARTNEVPGHSARLVFRGGQAGTAGALWRSPTARAEVEAILAQGDVELFGLTPGLADDADSLALWFDLALSHNPDTRFFIGIPWAIGGQRTDTAMFDRMIEGYAETGRPVVEELRRRYPDQRIDYLVYGKMAPVMKQRMESGDLPDLEVMVARDRSGLFSDNGLGHAGPMLIELCALTWMQALYDRPPGRLELRDYRSDVPGMVEEVMAYNRGFRPAAIPATPAPEVAPPAADAPASLPADAPGVEDEREVGSVDPEVAIEVGEAPVARAAPVVEHPGDVRAVDLAV